MMKKYKLMDVNQGLGWKVWSLHHGKDIYQIVLIEGVLGDLCITISTNTSTHNYTTYGTPRHTLDASTGEPSEETILLLMKNIKVRSL